MRRTLGAVAVVAGLGGAGCPESEPEGPSIVLENFQSPAIPEPRETWKDKASGLVFQTPGLGWVRLEGAELAGLGPDVKVGVREVGGAARCMGWAVARPAGEDGARAAADKARAALTQAWGPVQVQVDEDVKWDLWTARRYEVAGNVEGQTHAERATWWLDGGLVYGVVARSWERDYASRRRCLDRVTAGFSLGLRE